MRDVILALFESGALQERIKEIISGIKLLDEPTRRLTIFGALLSVAGLQQFGSITEVSDFIDFRNTYEELKEAYAKNNLDGLIKADRSEISFRSVALAEFILKHATTIKAILSTSKTALFRIDKYYADDPYFDALSRNLLRYSHYGKLVKSESDTDEIEKFYDDCRVLTVAQKEPLFWVQRSICNMNAKRFSISEKYVNTARAIAKTRENYDTYQIDNHNAKMILSQSLAEGVSPGAEKEAEAQRLLNNVIFRKHDELYHPLSVMRLYIDIISKHGYVMDSLQREQFKAIIASAVSSMSLQKFKHHPKLPTIEALKNRLQEAVLKL